MRVGKVQIGKQAQRLLRALLSFKGPGVPAPEREVH